MKNTTLIEAVAETASGAAAGNSHLKFDITAAPSGDASMFRAALERHMTAQQPPAAAPGAGKPSLGDKLAGRATNLASEIKKDQLYVSRMLEQASRTGDSMQLMRAMMALNDYQIRVQTISKTVSKATQSFEQLTKLQ